MAIESINPATNKLLRSFEPLTNEAARQKIALADDAFRAHANVPLEHRALWMRKLAAILEHETKDLATLITLEMGKPFEAARFEILKFADVCRYSADNAARILAPESIPTEPNHSYVRWEPLGIVLAVMPWNFPFWQVFRFLAPALMAGNVGLLKHASNVPQCAIAIETIMRRAGLSDGAFQTLLIGSKKVADVILDPRVAAVTLTGSEAAGQNVTNVAGSTLKKCVLELGGSDPFVVLPSADLEQAVETGVKARMMNNGQSCICAKRFIVHSEVYAEFEKRFISAVGRLSVGDPIKNDTDIGPLATPDGIKTLERQVKDLVAGGARILAGGQRLPGEGNYYAPTVLSQIPENSPVYHQELFGPVATLFEVADLDKAIELANDTPYVLASSVWTRIPAEQERCIREIEAGQTFINAMTASDPRLPFGGVKKSGYGRELGALGTPEFTNIKTVVIARSAPLSA